MLVGGISSFFSSELLRNLFEVGSSPARSRACTGFSLTMSNSVLPVHGVIVSNSIFSYQLSLTWNVLPVLTYFPKVLLWWPTCSCSIGQSADASSGEKSQSRGWWWKRTRSCKPSSTYHSSCSVSPLKMTSRWSLLPTSRYCGCFSVSSIFSILVSSSSLSSGKVSLVRSM